jgi:hypothetical protein
VLEKVAKAFAAALMPSKPRNRPRREIRLVACVNGMAVSAAIQA